MKGPCCRCVGEVRKLAAGGGHSAVLTDACSLKELCEFRLADSVTLSNASEIEDVAFRTGADALARLCGRLRYLWFYMADGSLSDLLFLLFYISGYNILEFLVVYCSVFMKNMSLLCS